MGNPLVIQVEDNSRVAEVRRAALAMAQREGLDESLASNSAIVATELATNLAKYARQGEIHILPLTERGSGGIEVVSIDQGPGMASIQESLTDGFSTSGTSGTGLGAVRRLSSEVDFYSLPGKGTVVTARIFTTSRKTPNFSLGVAAKPISGEVVSGDTWGARFHQDFALLIVADGLGHGLQASDASVEAIQQFLKTTDTAPIRLLERVHAGLRGTRGAAVSIAKIEYAQRRVIFAGLGNVAGVVISGSLDSPRIQAMISYNGTAGHEARAIKEFTYAFGPEDIIVMHSDGLSSHWNLADNPGLLRKHPSTIAATLYRDCARHRDDVCVLVGKRP